MICFMGSPTGMPNSVIVWTNELEELLLDVLLDELLVLDEDDDDEVEVELEAEELLPDDTLLLDDDVLDELLIDDEALDVVPVG